MPYPLASLLELRDGEQKSAAAALATAEHALAQAHLRLTEARDEQARRQASLEGERAKSEAALSAGGRTAADAQAAERWLSALRARRDEATGHVTVLEAAAAEAEKACERAREALAEAVRARKAIEQHREQWEAEERKAEERKAEDELDELAGRRRS